jgi:hypothetical protein
MIQKNLLLDLSENEKKLEIKDTLKEAGYEDSTIRKIMNDKSLMEYSIDQIINKTTELEKEKNFEKFNFINKKTKENKYTKKIILEKCEYNLTVKCYGFFEEFTPFIAQRGDLKGSIKLKGNGASIRYGSKLNPANLNLGGVIYNVGGERAIKVDKIESMLVSKSHKRQNKEIIKELLKEGLENIAKSWEK